MNINTNGYFNHLYFYMYICKIISQNDLFLQLIFLNYTTILFLTLMQF